MPPASDSGRTVDAGTVRWFMMPGRSQNLMSKTSTSFVRDVGDQLFGSREHARAPCSSWTTVRWQGPTVCPAVSPDCFLAGSTTDGRDAGRPHRSPGNARQTGPGSRDCFARLIGPGTAVASLARRRRTLEPVSAAGRRGERLPGSGAGPAGHRRRARWPRWAGGSRLRHRHRAVALVAWLITAPEPPQNCRLWSGPG